MSTIHDDCPRHPQCTVWAWQDASTQEVFRRCAICGWFLHLDAAHPRNAPLVEAPIVRTFLAFETEARKCYQHAVTPMSMAVHALGLVGEAGEVSEPIKKLLRSGIQPSRDRMVEELGDVLWYVVAVAHDFGLSLEEIATANVAKLAKRYPDGPPPIAAEIGAA